MLTDKIQLEADETILIQVRKHWFILALEVAGIVIGSIFPFVALGFLSRSLSFSDSLTLFPIPASVITALGSAWLLIMWMALFNIWTNYFLDLWIVTNKRLIAIDQRGLFNRRVSSFRLERLQDLTVEISGLLATLLDYGTLRAQTAGGDGNEFIATGLPKPRELKALILQASDSVMNKGVASGERRMEV